ADGLAINSGGSLFAFRRDGINSFLVSINGATGAATSVGGIIGERDIRGAGFDLSGKLWAIDAARNALIQVNTATGNEVAGATRGLSLGGVDYNVSDGTDIAANATGRMLMTDGAKGYFIDTATGALTLAFDHSAIVEGLTQAGAPFPPYYTG